MLKTLANGSHEIQLSQTLKGIETDSSGDNDVVFKRNNATFLHKRRSKFIMWALRIEFGDSVIVFQVWDSNHNISEMWGAQHFSSRLGQQSAVPKRLVRAARGLSAC